MQRGQRRGGRHRRQVVGRAAVGPGHRHAGALRAETGRLAEERVRDQQRRLRVLEVVRDLGRREQHVERHHRAARVEDPEVRDRELGHVRHHHRHVLPGPHAALVQARRHAARGAVELGVGERALVQADRHVLGPVVGGCLEDAAEVQAHGTSESGPLYTIPPRERGENVDVIVFGAGAVGLGLASALLAEASARVRIVARPGVAAALREHGLVRSGIFGNAFVPPERLEIAGAAAELAGPPADCVLVATKAFACDAAAAALAAAPRAIGAGTLLRAVPERLGQRRTLHRALPRRARVERARDHRLPQAGAAPRGRHRARRTRAHRQSLRRERGARGAALRRAREGRDPVRAERGHRLRPVGEAALQRDAEPARRDPRRQLWRARRLAAHARRDGVARARDASR